MRLELLILGMSLGVLTHFALADDDAERPETASDAEIVIPSQQPADAPLRRLDPVRRRTPEEERKLDALAHFMAAELYLERGQDDLVPKALQELQQAIELNPTEIEAYRLYLPAAVRLGEDENARKYALLATEKAPDGVQLLRALVAIYVQQGQVDRAIAALEESQSLESLAEKSFARMILQRHLGQCYALEKQTDKAAETYRKLFESLQPEPEGLSDPEQIQLFGEQGELYEDMGNAFLAAELPELAVEAFDVSVQKHGRSPGLHSFNLAQVFHQSGKSERALDELDKYFGAQHVEKGRAPYQLLKEVLAELKREDQLLPRLEELAAKDKHNKFLHHFLASELVERDELDRAEEIYTKMGGQSDPESLLGLTSIYRRQGKYEDWLKTAGRAHAVLQLGNSQVRTRLSEEYQQMGDRFLDDLDALAKDDEQRDGVLRLGRKLSSGDDPKLEFDEAIVLAKIAVAAEETEDVGRFYRYAIGMQNLPNPELFHDLGVYYIDVKQYRDAERAFQDAAEHPALDPLKAFFLNRVSVARELDGRIDDAIAAIREVRKMEPDDSDYALQEARIYYRARRWDDAVDVFESIIREFSDNEDLVRDCKFSLSAVLVQKGEFDRGEQILLDILTKLPDHPQANNDLGYLWADRDKNLEQAREMITKALTAEPDNAAYMDSMGWVLYRLGEYAEAAKHLEKASHQPRGEDPTIFDHLGDTRAKLGQQGKAVEAWRRALELEEEKSAPDPEMLEKLRRKLPTEVPVEPDEKAE